MSSITLHSDSGNYESNSHETNNTPFSSRDHLLTGYANPTEEDLHGAGNRSQEMAWFTIRSDNWTGFSPRPSRKMSKQRKIALFKSYLPDWIICIVLAIVFFSLDAVPGFKRQFSIEDASELTPDQYCFITSFSVHLVTTFCTSDSLRFQYAVHERVPPVALYFIAVIAPFVLQIVANVLTIRSLWDFHNSTLGLLLGLTLTGAITQFTKITVGRPRPDVISRCQPPAGVTNPEYGLVTVAICTQTSEAILRDGWRSFPSGHSSLSFAGLGFLSFYLAGKMHLFDEKGHTTKAWIALTPLSGAALVAISRTMDYRHHWQDVLVGSLLGLLMSFFAYRQYYPPLSSPRAHRPFSPRIRRSGEDGEEGVIGEEPSPSDESHAPILPVTRPGMGRESLGLSESRLNVHGTGGGGRRSPEVITHPAVPHMHPIHGGHPSHELDPDQAYKSYGRYRDEGSVEDLQRGGRSLRKGGDVGEADISVERDRYSNLSSDEGVEMDGPPLGSRR